MCSTHRYRNESSDCYDQTSVHQYTNPNIHSISYLYTVSKCHRNTETDIDTSSYVDFSPDIDTASDHHPNSHKDSIAY